MRAWARHLLLTGLVVSAVGAQDRQPVHGGAELTPGKAWPRAAVTLLSRPVPGDERFGEPDVVCAQADAAGRFVAKLLPGRRYTAWASEELADGTYRVSRPFENAACLLPVWLSADGAPRERARVNLKGIDEWRGREALVIRFLSSTRNVILAEARLGEGEEVTVPVLPGSHAFVEVLCDGVALLPWPMQVGLTDAKPETVYVRASRPALFRFVDAATSKPIEGARFTQLSFDTTGNGRQLVRELAKSDADGYAVPALPISRRDFNWVNYSVLATAKGYAPAGTIERLNIPSTHDPELARKSGEPVYTFRLRPARAVRAKLTLAGEPLANAELLVRTEIHGANESGMLMQPTLPTKTDAHGECVLELDPRSRAVLTMLTTPALLARVAAKARSPLHPIAALAAIEPGTEPVDLAIDVGKLAPLTLQLVAPDGGPADTGNVALFADEQGTVPLLKGLSADRTGTARVLLADGLHPHACAWTADGWFSARLPDRERQDGPLAIRLARCASIEARVADEQDNPIPGTELVFYLSCPGRLAALPQALAPFHLTTDANGKCRVPLYPDLAYSLGKVITPHDCDFPRSREFVVGKDEPERLDIVAKRR